MGSRREKLLKRLKSMPKPVACPTVLTTDMGIEYVVASSEGAEVFLGRYGDWPLQGPFRLSADDLGRLEQSSGRMSLDDAPFQGTALEALWAAVVVLFSEVERDDAGNALSIEERRRDFVSAILGKHLRPSQEFYIYFDACGAYDRELPRVFTSRGGLIDHFMSLHSLIPWEEMATETLEDWVSRLEDLKDVVISDR